jgi:hypothetical protein
MPEPTFLDRDAGPARPAVLGKHLVGQGTRAALMTAFTVILCEMPCPTFPQQVAEIHDLKGISLHSSVSILSLQS